MMATTTHHIHCISFLARLPDNYSLLQLLPLPAAVVAPPLPAGGQIIKEVVLRPLIAQGQMKKYWTYTI